MNQEVVDCLEQHELPFATANELAQEMGVNNSAMNKRLDEIVKETCVESKKVGARAKIYYLPKRAKEVSDY